MEVLLLRLLPELGNSLDAHGRGQVGHLLGLCGDELVVGAWLPLRGGPGRLLALALGRGDALRLVLELEFVLFRESAVPLRDCFTCLWHTHARQKLSGSGRSIDLLQVEAVRGHSEARSRGADGALLSSGGARGEAAEHNSTDENGYKVEVETKGNLQRFKL